MTNYFRRLTVKCNGQSWTRISFRIKTDYAVTVSDSNLTSQPLFVFMVRLYWLTEDMIPIQAFNLYLNVWDHLTKWLLIRIGPGLSALGELSIQAYVLFSWGFQCFGSITTNCVVESEMTSPWLNIMISVSKDTILSFNNNN